MNESGRMNVNEPIEKSLSMWQAAGVIDAETAARIRAFESQQASMERLRWPVLVALGLGGLVICAGVLLFVAAHWDELSPGERFTVVALLTAVFPVLGAFAAPQFPALATTLFAVGTVTTGAGIFMTAQIFNLEEHWPNGILLWALAALAGWILLRDWPQAAMLAILAPAWLASDWSVRTENYRGGSQIMLAGLMCLAITYFTVDRERKDSGARTAMVRIGGLGILPGLGVLVAVNNEAFPHNECCLLSVSVAVIGWIVALGVPFAVAFYTRRERAWANGIAAIWVVLLGLISRHSSLEHSVASYLWLAIGAAGLIAWGMSERVKDRVNVGVVAFALTVLGFYFSNVMDRLDRSASLVGLGLLLIAGGWAMERMRRRLVARLGEGGQ
jgi:uncharacterized membrane protein